MRRVVSLSVGGGSVRRAEDGGVRVADAQRPGATGDTAARPLGRCRDRRIAVIRVVRVEGCHEPPREYHKSGLGETGGGRWLGVRVVAVQRKRWNGEIRRRATVRGLGRGRRMMDLTAALPIWINGGILACHSAVLDLGPLDHLRAVRAGVVSELGSRTWSWWWGFGPFKGRTPAFGRKRKTPRWWPACHPRSRNEVEETRGARLDTWVAGVALSSGRVADSAAGRGPCRHPRRAARPAGRDCRLRPPAAGARGVEDARRLDRRVQAAVDVQRRPVARRDRLLERRRLGRRLLLGQRHGLRRRRRAPVEHPPGRRQAHRVAAHDDYLIRRGRPQPAPPTAPSAASPKCRPRSPSRPRRSARTGNIARPPSSATGSLCGE